MASQWRGLLPFRFPRFARAAVVDSQRRWCSTERIGASSLPTTESVPTSRANPVLASRHSAMPFTHAFFVSAPTISRRQAGQ
jgi:hypothetical protein